VVAPQRETRNVRELTTTLNVEGKQVTFLVDTGATRSTLKQGEIKNLPLSGDLVSVVGVSGRREDIPISETHSDEFVGKRFAMQNGVYDNVQARGSLHRYPASLAGRSDDPHDGRTRTGSLLVADCVTGGKR